MQENLQDTENFFQFQGDADDLGRPGYRMPTGCSQGKTWGRDEGATRALGKKHKDFLEELEESRGVMEHLEQQAQDFPKGSRIPQT